MSLQITDVQVYIPKSNSSILGMVTVTFNNLLKVNDYKIIKSKKGDAFVSAPSRSYQANDGTTKYVNIVEVLGEELGPEFSRQILDAYNRKVSGSSVASTPRPQSNPSNSKIPQEYREKASGKINSPALKGQEKDPWNIIDDEMDQF
jgi:DNA-binding cell septation regulator SpoVG